jgi:putative heme iron utilization protein
VTCLGELGVLAVIFRAGDMTPEDRDLLKDLLAHQRVLSLAVLVDGEPYVGLLPFAILPDFSAALVHASRLARHTAGLRTGAPFSLLVHLPDHAGTDPLQLPRVTLQGKVNLLAKDGQEYAAARSLYLAKFPDSAQTFALGDFNLYTLAFDSGRFVAGFGRIYNLSADTLRQLKD